MKPGGYSRRQQELSGWAITVETYRLGEVYYCTIANIDPRSWFARAEGPSHEEAERQVFEKATRYLSQPRRLPLD